MSVFDRFRWPYPVLKQAILNLKSGTSFKGIIWQRAHGYIVLRNAELLTDQNTPVRKPVDGEILIDERHIDFIQVVT